MAIHGLRAQACQGLVDTLLKKDKKAGMNTIKQYITPSSSLAGSEGGSETLEEDEDMPEWMNGEEVAPAGKEDKSKSKSKIKGKIKSWLGKKTTSDVEEKDPDDNDNNQCDSDITAVGERAPRMKKYLFAIRIMYLVDSIMMAIAAIAAGFYSLQTAFFGIYILIFSFMIGCSSFSCGIPYIKGVLVDWFGFLFHSVGRMIFVALVSLMLYSLNIIGIIALVMLALTTLFHLYLDYQFPEMAGEFIK
jgi:hypothetical protein